MLSRLSMATPPVPKAGFQGVSRPRLRGLWWVTVGAVIVIWLRAVWIVVLEHLT